MRPDAGFTLIETLVAMVLMLVITGAVFGMVNPGVSAAYAQPEAMDMQQRARIGTDLLSRDLFMAGAGVYAGPSTGTLTNFFAPIIPRRMGLTGADAYTVARADAVTISYIPNTYSQTTIRDAMPLPSAELKVNDMPNCPKGRELCGFTEGMTVLIFDVEGHFDFFTITNVQDSAGHLQHRQQDLSYPYQPGSLITQAESHTYYYDAVARQLRHYDGNLTDVPVVDNVVGVLFEYFGDPNPPTKPKPPVGTANCLYDAAGNPLGGMSALTPEGGSLAPLPLSILNNGPWCGAGSNRFDADLLRVKKVRITLRVQASKGSMRATGGDYAVAGTSKSAHRALSDYTVAFEVAPRNMNLGR
ncbi:MAG: prepilin-type N-terminal cleavage/methylation domain-containing protein [Vicinamibacterales bacterium]